ncbi:MAG TPA: hypothetical protein VMG31_05805 [Verrucomicrobiae bacterium]|nr:hypothetical protein [Verrucomicrobiae bacterium]
MKNSKISVSGGGLPPSIASLPLAWDWRFLRIDDKSLSEFAKHIHWIIQCEPDQAEKDALNLLRELVDKARSEWKLTRVELKQAVYAQRFQYYKSVAQLIVDHPQVSLEELRRKHGLSHWAMDRARKLFKVNRKQGTGSSAYKKSTSTSHL